MHNAMVIVALRHDREVKENGADHRETRGVQTCADVKSE